MCFSIDQLHYAFQNNSIFTASWQVIPWTNVWYKIHQCWIFFPLFWYNITVHLMFIIMLCSVMLYINKWVWWYKKHCVRRRSQYSYYSCNKYFLQTIRVSLASTREWSVDLCTICFHRVMSVQSALSMLASLQQTVHPPKMCTQWNRNQKHIQQTCWTSLRVEYRLILFHFIAISISKSLLKLYGMKYQSATTI